MIQYKRVSSNDELKQIIVLQEQNLTGNISEDEKKSDGFVTIQYTMELLLKMNVACPHIIAKDDQKVVGYALCCTKELANDVGFLKNTLIEIESVSSVNTNYIVMGQICIDKEYRKRGIFRGLYGFMKHELNSEFDMVFTEVNLHNQRSLNAHYSIGYKSFKIHVSKNQTWDLIHWDWK